MMSFISRNLDLHNLQFQISNLECPDLVPPACIHFDHTSCEVDHR